MKVLIVDDEHDICKYLQRELRKEGFAVEYTTSPVGVIERLHSAKIKGSPYDLFILDLKMPKIDGFELLKDIKEARFDLDVIIVTGYGDEEKAIEAIRLGAVDYITKPISLEEFHTAVFRIRQRRGGEGVLTHSVLIVDDEMELCNRIRRELDREGYQTAAAYDGKEGLNYFKNNRVDLVIADIRMPGMDGIEMLERCRAITDNFASIIITGHGDHQTAIEALKLGVFNYLKKPISLEELVVSVDKGINHLNLQRGLSARKRELEIETTIKERYARDLEKMVEERTKDIKKLSRAVEQSPNIAMITDIDGNIEYVNPKFTQTTGYSSKDIIGTNAYELGSQSPEECKQMRDTIASGREWRGEFYNKKKNGGFYWESASISSIKEKGVVTNFVKVAEDITERKQAEEEIRKLSSAVEQSIDGIAIADLELRLTYVNNAFALMRGYSPEKIIGMKLVDLLKKEDLDKYTSDLNKVKTLGSWTGEIEHIRKDGTPFPTFTSVNLLKDAEGRPTGILATVKDITNQKKLEAQLYHAQKMEAIGTLAGGVAHDFNNLLTVIIGNAQLALMNVIKDETLREGIEEIKKAGDRAASLTRQLLAFSRKQIIRPEVLDLNELLTGIEKMLGRLIGEDVELLTIPEPALWQVEADTGQMEQLIMNLAINARDAISACADSAAGWPQGGKITIETANTDLDVNYFREHDIEGEKPGHYVMLAVSDTGIGIDKETREHIFEPFFTTKEVGKGTGLGLSTVYGIVKQSNGFIWVYSEPGQGSTFKVYLPAIASAQARRAGLPRAEGDADSEEKQRLPVIELDGSETILIVEDDDGLRKFVQEVLLLHGYKVLDAENGEDALRVSEAHEGPIHLVITDVVMPKMGGKEAAERLQPFYPRMKVIYMSGYTDNAIVEHGVLAPGLNFLQKPFTPESLARKVREVLDSE